jgi:hypothetical protein
MFDNFDDKRKTDKYANNYNVINMQPIKPIEIDIMSIRTNRQNENNLLAYNSIIKKDLTNNINKEEYKRVLQELDRLNIKEDGLLEECRTNIITATLLSSRISINASRQGSKDEQLQLDVCKTTFSKCGIFLNNLSSTSFRPTKIGEIVDNSELKKGRVKKEDCLKSFDANFSGKINGWVFAKIVIGSGGHQDNVFEEAYTFCDWVLQYGIEKEIYIVLLDTNLTEKYNDLIKKYERHPNLLIGNHIKVQKYIIDNYYEDIEDTNK